MVNLLTELQTVLLNFLLKPDGSNPVKPSFVVELAEKQYYNSLQSMPDPPTTEQVHLDSGIDTADISSIETLHSSRMRGNKKIICCLRAESNCLFHSYFISRRPTCVTVAQIH